MVLCMSRDFVLLPQVLCNILASGWLAYRDTTESMSFRVILDWLTPTVLFGSAAVTYIHADYGSAVICGACAGFCLGMVCMRYVVR